MDFEECMKKDTFELKDFLHEMYFGFPDKNTSIFDASVSSSLSTSFEEDLTFAATGRHFTFKMSKMMKSESEGWLVLNVNRNFSLFIFLHDEEFFHLNLNSFGPPSLLRMYGNIANTQSHFFEIYLTRHKKLNLGRHPCVEDPDYSFKTCVKRALSKKV